MSTSAALDILEEKLTIAIQKLKLFEKENLELKKTIKDLLEKENYYKRIESDYISLKKNLKDVQEKENRITRIENDNIELRKQLKDAQLREKEISDKYNSMLDEVKALRQIRDSVRSRVIQLISKLESSEDKKTNENNQYTLFEKVINNDKNMNIDVKEAISFYDDEEKYNNNDDNEINFFIEEDSDDIGDSNIKESYDNDEESLF